MAATRTIPQWLRQTLIGLASVAAVVIGLWAYGKYVWYPQRFPFGPSHSCDKILLTVLRQYADGNDGYFPTGEASPEASLSLLSRPPWKADAELLRGKTAPKDVVEEMLAKGELLGSETCGWHYVEGLRTDDDSRLALFWDKAGLGQNGERMANGDRKISRISRANETIPGPEWKSFLKEQKMLLEKLPDDRKRLALKNFPD